MSECLSRLLFPFDAMGFLKHYQAREYFHVGRNSPGFYDDLLTVGDLDSFLQSEQVPAACINVIREGSRYPLEEWSRTNTSARGTTLVAVPDKLLNLYLEGATLVLNGADRTFPALNSLGRELTVDLGFPVHANVYITPRSAAGFSEHVDDHEVLVLQIAGGKRWLLHPKEAPAVEIDLQCGDLLFIPSGLAHAAKAEDCDSIHLTVGLTPVYASDLIAELASRAGEDADFRQPAPPRFAGDDARRTFEATFLDRVQRLLLRTKPSDLMDRRLHSLMKTPARGWPGRFSDMRLLSQMTPETIVCRRREIIAVVKSEGKVLSVEFVDKRVIVPCFLEDAIGKIMCGDTFAVGEIRGLIGSEGKIKLVREFVTAGLLQIVKI